MDLFAIILKLFGKLLNVIELLFSKCVLLKAGLLCKYPTGDHLSG